MQKLVNKACDNWREFWTLGYHRSSLTVLITDLYEEFSLEEELAQRKKGLPPTCLNIPEQYLDDKEPRSEIYKDGNIIFIHIPDGVLPAGVVSPTASIRSSRSDYNLKIEGPEYCAPSVWPAGPTEI